MSLTTQMHRKAHAACLVGNRFLEYLRKQKQIFLSLVRSKCGGILTYKDVIVNRF